MKHCGTKTLETNRLILRRYTLNDAEAMYKNYASSEEVVKFLNFPVHTNVEVSKSVIQEWIDSYEKDSSYIWAIVLKENGPEPIGTISVVEQNEGVGMVNIGYSIGEKWWHQGITSEALHEVMRFFFEVVEVNRVELCHDPNNPHSGGVMRKCGLKYEGTLRRVGMNNQGICDSCYYGMLREEWNDEKIGRSDK
ncbi:MAG: GNAT family N-acetyltransferase [Clostridiales bacterium]|nr:GNAT family N-acetyltransferase [Clostridiales bacterium]